MDFQSTVYYLREYFFPSGCGGCGKALGPVDARYGLCGKCRAAFGIALVIGRRCRYCGKPLISETEGGACLSCREQFAAEKLTGERTAGGKGAAEINRNSGCSMDCYNVHVKRLRLLFPYVGKFRTVLGSYKFERAAGLGIFFARCLSLSLEAFELQALEKAAWVPVPPRPGKLKKHGWDQIEFLAKAISKAGGFAVGKTGRPAVRRCLVRLPSRSQKQLNREERLRNLKGRIICKKKPPETAILFDDVITTGATIDACAAALLEAGAKQVYAVCLFYR